MASRERYREYVIENMFPATVKVLHSEKFLTFVYTQQFEENVFYLTKPDRLAPIFLGTGA